MADFLAMLMILGVTAITWFGFKEMGTNTHQSVRKEKTIS